MATLVRTTFTALFLVLGTGCQAQHSDRQKKQYFLHFFYGVFRVEALVSAKTFQMNDYYLITKIRKIRRICKQERTYYDRLLILQPLDRNADVDGDLHHFPHRGITFVTALEIERRSHMKGAGIPLRFGRFQDLLHRRIIGRNNL